MKKLTFKEVLKRFDNETVYYNKLNWLERYAIVMLREQQLENALRVELDEMRIVSYKKTSTWPLGKLIKTYEEHEAHRLLVALLKDFNENYRNYLAHEFVDDLNFNELMREKAGIKPYYAKLQRFLDKAFFAAMQIHYGFEHLRKNKWVWQLASYKNGLGNTARFHSAATDTHKLLTVPRYTFSMNIISTFSSFSVSDIEVAKKFYADVLGVGVKQTPEGLELELAGNRVFLYPKPNHQPATFTVLNFLVSDMDEVVDELAAKGVAFEHYDDPYMKTDEKGICRNDGTHPGPKAIAWLKDPAGNFLALIQEK